MTTTVSHAGQEDEKATARTALLALSRDLGAEHRRLAILGEGNTSARLDAETFLVKASGSSLGTLGEDDLVACRFDALLPLLDAAEGTLDDAAVDDALLASRVDGARAKKPSVEAVFHAWLLTQPGIQCVAHTHPDEVAAVLCSPRAAEFAARRRFPDEVVCCGPASLLVPYTDPGLALARAIRTGHEAFAREHGGRPPRVILLGNHGVICPGATPAAARTATLMTAKAAGIFRRAAALGAPTCLSEADVRRIDGRQDEHYRRRALEGHSP